MMTDDSSASSSFSKNPHNYGNCNDLLRMSGVNSEVKVFKKSPDGTLRLDHVEPPGNWWGIQKRYGRENNDE